MGGVSNQTVKAPRWAVTAAHLAALTVLPSCVWRLAMVAGFDLGYHPAWIEANASSVSDRAYLVGLSLLTEGLVLLTLGLVRPWGERLPAWLPLLYGRAVPTMAALVPAGIGAVCLIGLPSAGPVGSAARGRDSRVLPPAFSGGRHPTG